VRKTATIIVAFRGRNNFSLWIALSSPLAALYKNGPKTPAGGPDMKTPKLGREVMAAIGRDLRLLYREITIEGVPERFAAILRRLDDPPRDESLKNEPPVAPSASSQHVSRDDEVPNDRETHESVGFTGSLSALLPTELVPA
jgi:hypothetical protein